MIKFSVAAVVLLALGGCSQKVTLEDLGNLKHETSLSDVKRILGEPDRELAFGTTPDYRLHLVVYVVGWEEFLLIFDRGSELPESEFILNGKQRLTAKKKKLLADDYLNKFEKPIPLSWQ